MPPLDLNLLRLFDAVYRERSVSRAAQTLGLTQPTASQGLTRLRGLLHDPLFTRAPGGVRPTLRAERLAASVQAALTLIERALDDSEAFEPKQSRRVFRFHMSDIGEARFLPELMADLREQAPLVRCEAAPLAHSEIATALDAGKIDLAFGYLPSVHDTRRVQLLTDCYGVLLRADHPFLQRQRKPGLPDLQRLEFAAVRSHSDTLRILQLLKLEDRLRLTVAHFLSLPGIVRASDLAALMPCSIALGFVENAGAGGGYALLKPRFPLPDFSVALHWSVRHEGDPALRWLRALIVKRFGSAET